MGWFSHQLVNDEGKENDPHFFPYTVEVGTSGGESAGFGEKILRLLLQVAISI